MNNPKSLNKHSYSKVLRRVVAFRVKIDLLKKQISALENLKNFPITAIATFLLKCQILEFEIKQLIFSLDLYIYAESRVKGFTRKVRTPKDLEGLTLGKLAREINHFLKWPNESMMLKGAQSISGKGSFVDFKKVLSRVLSKRNKFTHELFSSDDSIAALTKQARKGIEDANKALVLLNKVQDELNFVEKS